MCQFTSKELSYKQTKGLKAIIAKKSTEMGKTRYPWLSGKYKLKPQWDNITTISFCRTVELRHTGQDIKDGET